MNLKERYSFGFKHVMLPLFLGGLIYILFRSTKLRMFAWFSFIGLDGVIRKTRTFFFAFKNYIPNWIYFSLPDGLWIYSFTSALIIYWDNKNKSIKTWLLIPFTMGILIEILQGMKLFPGTFDYLDLMFSMSGFILSKKVINNKYKQNEKQLS